MCFLIIKSNRKIALNRSFSLLKMNFYNLKPAHLIKNRQKNKQKNLFYWKKSPKLALLPCFIINIFNNKTTNRISLSNNEQTRL